MARETVEWPRDKDGNPKPVTEWTPSDRRRVMSAKSIKIRLKHPTPAGDRDG